jgi:sugar/nucleoside kinase (ribokinase family)
MANPRYDVLGWGAVAIDDLIYVDHHPAPDTKISVHQELRQGGGLTATALVAVARLGGRAAYAGVLGDDELSRDAVAGLEDEAVDCSLVLRQAGAAPIHARVIVDRSTGGRSILANRTRCVQRPAEAITPDLLRQTRVLFVDSTASESGLRGALVARELGIPVVADIEHSQNAAAAALMAAADHCIVGEEVAAAASGCADPAEAVRVLAARGHACAVVTAGARGAWFSVAGGPVQHQPAFGVAVVDTTGCGDVFHGAYALCLARGIPLPEAIRLAGAAAALKATRPGGRAGIPTWEALAAFLAVRP